MKYREDELGFKEKFTALGLTARRNLCVHDEVRFFFFSGYYFHLKILFMIKCRLVNIKKGKKWMQNVED